MEEVNCIGISAFLMNINPSWVRTGRWKCLI